MEKSNIKIRLKGHETFILREGWINKGLHAVAENDHVFSENSGADALGVGTNMAKAIRYWLMVGGFIEDSTKRSVGLSEIGEEIYKNDPYLEDDFALWIFHCNLVCNPAKATSWYLFFNCFELEEFNKDEMFLLLKRLVLQYAGVDEISERSLNDDCTAILSMYTKEKIKDYDPEDKKISPFSRFGLLKKEGNKYRKQQAHMDYLDAKVVLYLIAQYFEKNACNSVSIDDLLKKKELPGKVLQLKRVNLNEYLDQLSDEGFITVNRTAGLDMVYQKTKMAPLAVVKEYYKNMNG